MTDRDQNEGGINPSFLPRRHVTAREVLEEFPCEIMVERVAAALANTEITHHRSESCPQRWADMARAAITAMREPTEAMKRAGGTCYVATDLWYPAPEEAGECWRVMIDAALKD